MALKQYQAIDRELRGIEEALARLRARLESPAMPKLSETPKGRKTETDRLGNMVAKILELEALYNDKQNALIDIQRQLEEALERLDPMERTLMRLRYLQGLSWERVCADMSYSWNVVHRIHRVALLKLDEKAHTNAQMNVL